ncbi:unnamed protein product [Polarella glacialis]|uniref:Protein O-GlcNAc transferase n=1 Tax=Polarella glacialis TaxID=89957 RepID=A0A813GSP8_POLGL|nr:unnamed protein product [Polarella glacialis]
MSSSEPLDCPPTTASPGAAVSELPDSSAMAEQDDNVETDETEGPKSPLMRAVLHVKWACFLQKAGQHERAAEHFASSLALFPSARAHFGRGTCLASVRRRLEAAQELESALRLCPKMVAAHVNLAGVQLALGRYDEAEIHCRRALELEPGSREALMNLANTLRNLGRRDEAVQLVWGRILCDQATSEELPPSSSPCSPSAPSRPAAVVQCSRWTSFSSTALPLTVACLKWGKRYEAAYVNRLCTAVRRQLPNSAAVRLICFTDDAFGIDSSVEVRSLPEGLPLWWGKAYLFSEAAGLDGHRASYSMGD